MNQPIEVDRDVHKRVCEEREQQSGLAPHKAAVCGLSPRPNRTVSEKFLFLKVKTSDPNHRKCIHTSNEAHVQA